MSPLPQNPSLILIAVVFVILTANVNTHSFGEATRDCAVTVTGSESAGESDPIIFSATPANYKTYHWELSVGTILSGQGTSAISVGGLAGGSSCTATVTITTRDGCSSSASQTTNVTAFLSADLMQLIKADREKAQSYAQLVSSEFDPSSEPYIKSKAMYSDAQTAVDEWAYAVATAIQQDKIHTAASQKQLQDLGAIANARAQQFIAYVDDLPVQPQAKGVFFASPERLTRQIADELVIPKSWPGLKWMSLRKTVPKTLKNAATWQTWDQLQTSPKEEPLPEKLKQPSLAASASRSSQVTPGAAAERYALLVGVERYEGATPLSGPNKDVCALRQVLVTVGNFKPENVIVLATPGSCPNFTTLAPNWANLEATLIKLKSEVNRESFFLFAFSGHGLAKGSESYLMLQDSDWTEIEKKSISVDYLSSKLLRGDSAPRHSLFLIDACRNPGTGAAKSEGLAGKFSDSFGRLLSVGSSQSVTVLFSATLGEQSYIRSTGPVSFFTWAVIRALIGEAADQSGNVTVGALTQLVEKEVPDLIRVDFLANNAAEQHPTAGSFGLTQEDFVIAQVPTPSTRFFYSIEAFIVPKSKDGKTLALPLHVDLVSPRPLNFLDETIPLNVSVTPALNVITIPYDKIDPKKVAQWHYLVRMTFHYGRWHRAFVMCPASPNVPDGQTNERSQEIKTQISDGVLVIDPLISFMMWGHALRDPDGVMGEEGASGTRIEYKTYAMKCLDRK